MHRTVRRGRTAALARVYIPGRTRRALITSALIANKNSCLPASQATFFLRYLHYEFGNLIKKTTPANQLQRYVPLAEQIAVDFWHDSIYGLYSFSHSFDCTFQKEKAVNVNRSLWLVKWLFNKAKVQWRGVEMFWKQRMNVGRKKNAYSALIPTIKRVANIQLDLVENTAENKQQPTNVKGMRPQVGWIQQSC